jgi:hypothetical protein
MVDDKAHVYLIMLSSMCVGAKSDEAKRITKTLSLKREMKIGVSNLLEELDFILKLSIGTPYYQEGL